MLKPVRYDLYEKALNKQPKTKVDKRMITVEDALLFAEWANTKYYKSGSVWYLRGHCEDRSYTTRELWELYQQFLGKKG